MQVAGAEATVDEEFDELYRLFLATEENSAQIVRDLKAYSEAKAQMCIAAQTLSEVWDVVPCV